MLSIKYIDNNENYFAQKLIDQLKIVKGKGKRNHSQPFYVVDNYPHKLSKLPINIMCSMLIYSISTKPIIIRKANPQPQLQLKPDKSNNYNDNNCHMMHLTGNSALVPHTHTRAKAHTQRRA